MTPKEKAQELVQDMYDTSSHPHSVAMRKRQAKELASKHAQKILDSLSPYLGDDNAREYWQSVKTEIENL